MKTRVQKYKKYLKYEWTRDKEQVDEGHLFQPRHVVRGAVGNRLVYKHLQTAFQKAVF